jgi:purine-binding chemotaxis protein CheW
MSRDLTTNQSLLLAAAVRLLIMQLGVLRCALRIEHVVETLRPLPILPVAHPAPSVLGLSVIRGEPLPVIDLAKLLGCGGNEPGRFVVIRSGNRKVVLAVEAVVGVRVAPAETLGDLPPLMSGAAAGAITSLGALDRELVLVLQTGQLIPEETWPLLNLPEKA